MIGSPQREGLQPHPDLLRHLDEARRELGREPGRMRVLDWGCGTGVAVESLRRQGWDVYGADIDERAVQAGNTLSGEQRLVVVTDAGRTRFPDGYFDLVYSQAVFEHVRDPLLAAQEIRRVTANGGIGFHLLPAPFMPIEPHIFMPFVHWLPKNELRRLWIMACCQLGIGLTAEVNKLAVQGMNTRQKVDFEYRYLDQQTFYRQFWQLGRAFRRVGFNVSYPVLRHHKLARLHRILGLPLLRVPAQLLVLSFISIHIQTKAVGDLLARDR